MSEQRRPYRCLHCGEESSNAGFVFEHGDVCKGEKSLGEAVASFFEGEYMSHAKMGNELTTEELLQRRVKQIEAAKTRMNFKPGPFIKVTVEGPDEERSGLKFRSTRHCANYLLDLHSAFSAILRHEAMKLGYMPATNESPTVQGCGMWAEDAPPGAHLPETHGGGVEKHYCKWCISEPGAGTKDCELVTDPVRVAGCPKCGREPLQVRLESYEDFKAHGGVEGPRGEYCCGYMREVRESNIGKAFSHLLDGTLCPFCGREVEKKSC